MQNGSDRSITEPVRAANWKRFAGDMVVPLLLGGYATHYYLSVAQMPQPRTNLLLIEPVYWILISCCVLFCGSRLLQVLRRLPGVGVGADISRENGVAPGRALAFVGLTGGCIWLIPILGFVTATICYTFFMLVALGIRSRPILGLTPLLLVIPLWLAMEYFLGIPLPAGFLR